MKKIVWLLFGVILLMLAGGLFAQERQGPRIEVKQDRHDFGQTVQGTDAVHVFEIKNIGDEPLIIEKVQTS